MAVDKNKLEQEACVLRFYKIVLSWDYDRILEEAENRNCGRKKRDASALELKEVKDTYKDIDDYLDTFEPLLFEEVKAQICQKDDGEEEKVCQEAMVAECSEVNGFHLPMVICSDPEKVSQNDLLLVSNKKFEGGKLPNAYAFALVEHRQQDKIRLRLYLGGEVKRFNTDEIHSRPRLLNMLPVVSEVKKIFFLEKICSLSTIVREYVAMQSISSLPFKDLILKAADTEDLTEDRAWKLSKPLKEFIESSHNKSQLEAIYAGLSRKSFVLIQGPPGTGKTQTILGLLSAILHATPPRVHSNGGKLVGVKRGPELPIQEKYSHWQKASPWLSGINPRDMIMPIDGDDGFFPTSGNDMKPEVVNSSRKYRVRVLVCAPSNSALDEIVLRILNTGIRDENDHAYSPKIVRIGLKPHHSVQAVSMDYLVEQKLASMGTQVGDKQKQGVANDKDNVRASILDEAVIVFSTLSFSGSPLFSKLNRGFDVVIIDEAAQAVEPATLVPLANGCKQVFLVGDPVQLPATVISTVATKYGYGTSLFKRFQRAGYPVQMLKTQYRMNPEIRSFPSKEFYEDALVDGPDLVTQTERSWHRFRCFGPFCFFDIHDGKESQPPGSGSWVNVDEVEFVLSLYGKLISSYPELKESSRLAIISPYRHQVQLFQAKFRSTFGVESAKLVDINTVDGFQGREKDVAIFSCVRANKDRSIGFVSDFRRMNVGITRARCSVLVVGSASTLRGDGHWKNLIESAEQRNVLFKVSKPYAEFFSEASLESMILKAAAPERPESPVGETVIDMAVDADADAAAAAVDHGQPEDNNYGEDGGDENYEEDFGED